MKNLTIGKKILLGFATILGLLIILSAFAVFEINKILHIGEEVINGNKLKSLVIQREVDHLNWVSALSKLLTDDHVHTFDKTTDPKKCGLGKWLYGEGRINAEKMIPTLKPIIDELEKRHITLHHSAETIKGHYKPTDTTLPAFLTQKETDHYAWTIALLKDILKGAKQTKIQTDATKCGFGKFIYGDKIRAVAKNNPKLAQYLEDIKGPHKTLHRAAIKINGFLKVGARDKALKHFNAHVIPQLNIVKGIFTHIKHLAHEDVAGVEKARGVFSKITTVALHHIQGLMKDMIKTVEKNIKSDKELIDETTKTSSITMVISAISIIVGILLTIFITRSIVGPLLRVIETIKDSSSEINTASGELSTASQSLAASSNEQASSIERTSASLEELSGMVSTNVSNAENSTKLADDVKVVSSKGGAAVQKLITSMGGILESNDQIQQLVNVIGEIGEKTAIIDEIVFQTKLLSFNASVEAERAGEHGRGFAVVAQEVGNLAQMSGKAALEISSIVKESIVNAKNITASNRAKVEDGNKLVETTAEILAEIEGKSKEVAANINNILSASKEQTIGIEQINTAVSEFDKTTQTNASTSEETASSSEELSAQAKNLNSIIEDLVSLVTHDYHKLS